MYDDAYTRNDNDELAVRTVSTSGDNGTNKDDVFTRDDEGRLAMRTVGGSGGGGSVDKNKIINKATSLPTPSANNLGQVYMYDGESNALYTHGYIYQVVAEQTASAVEFSGNIITSWAVADFVRYLQEGGSNYNEVVSGTLTYDSVGGLWVLVGYDTNGIKVFQFQEYTEDLVLFGCTFASETHQDGDTCTFTLTTTASGYKWKQVDVQPASGSAGVSSVNGRIGAVVLGAKDVSAVPQYSTMPEATVSNVGEIAQYSGESIADSYQNGYFYKSSAEYSDPSATISQTVGSSLTDLSVNVDTFVEAEQPSGSETVSFVSGNELIIASPTSGTNAGITVTITNPELFVEKAKQKVLNDVGVVAVDVTWFQVAANRWLLDDPDFPGEQFVFGDFDFVNESTGEKERHNTAELVATASEQYPETWESWGLSVVGNSPSDQQTYVVFETNFEKSIPWSKNGVVVELADYGISYNGTPTSGDTLTVVYTAGGISGYVWNQINVQPGGTEGINWAGHWDKPADMQYYWYCAGFDFAMLPAGTYEFYFQNKQQWDEIATSAVWGTKTWKVTFVVTDEGGSRQVSGSLAWVLDGQTTFGNYNLSTEAQCRYFTDMATKDRIATLAGQTAGMITSSVAQQSVVPELFRWTNIKNTDTGLEYPVTVNVVQTDTPSLNYTLGDVTSGYAVNPPEIPAYYREFESEFNNSQQRFILSNAYDATETRTGSFAECDLEMVTANGHYRAKITNYIRSSILRVYEASGDLANVQIGTLDEGELQIMLNTPTDTTGNIRAVASVSGSAYNFFLNGLYEPWTLTRVLTPTKIGGTVTPENFGTILQYDGVTDSNYTNGYFYKATGTVVTVPESITTTILNYPNEVTVTIDVTNWIAALQTTYGWTKSTIQQWLLDYGSSEWNLNYDADNGSITRMYLPWYGDTTEASILQWVSVTYTGSEEGTFDVLFNETYTAEQTEIQNGRWERVDVQPSLESISGYDATKTQTLKNVQGVLTWVDD